VRILFFIFGMLLLPISCVSLRDIPRRSDEASIQSGEVQKEGNRRRTPAGSVSGGAEEITVFIPNKATRTLPGLATGFAIRSGDLQSREVSLLKEAILALKTKLGLAPLTALALDAKSILCQGDRCFVHFTQKVTRHPGMDFGYEIPVDGASVVAILRDDRLVSLNSSLMDLPAIDFVWEQPGFDLSAFTEREFNLFARTVRENGKNEEVAGYFAKVARNSGVVLDPGIWSSADPIEMRQKLSMFFAAIGPTSTLKILVGLARARELALIRHDDLHGGTGYWMLQVTRFFGLPLQFDIEFPRLAGRPLQARNLRSLTQPVVTISLFDSPAFPIKGQLELQVAEDAAISSDQPEFGMARILQRIVHYYRHHHGWLNYSGSDDDGRLDIHFNLKGKDDINNAAWTGRAIIVGAGSDRLMNQKNSATILAHEFTHAVIGYSSGLVYRGQSGALNEHAADIQGAIIASEIFGLPYAFTIGEDALNPEAVRPKKALLPLMLAAGNYSADDIQRYNLGTVGLRHLWAPELSFSRSFKHLDLVKGRYPDSCQPSNDNDQCGVHSASGVPNRAISMLIDQLGVEKVRNLLFTTFTARLTSRASFQDYLRQLYEECKIQPGLNSDTDCPLIIENFAAVGVQLPGQSSRLPGPSQPTPVPQPHPPSPEEGPNAPQPSPELKMCGWVSVKPSRNVTIIDNKYDTVILAAKYPNLTTGDYSAIYQAKCACVKGSIGMIQNSKGKWFHSFHNISEVKPLPKERCKGIQFK
jgi:hypothetical protein